MCDGGAGFEVIIKSHMTTEILITIRDLGFICSCPPDSPFPWESEFLYFFDYEHNGHVVIVRFYDLPY